MVHSGKFRVCQNWIKLTGRLTTLTAGIRIGKIGEVEFPSWWIFPNASPGPKCDLPVHFLGQCNRHQLRPVRGYCTSDIHELTGVASRK